jgi:fibronectin type 3 domain-containing protein
MESVMIRNIFKIEITCLVLGVLWLQQGWSQGQPEIIAVSGPQGNLILWSGAILPSSNPKGEDWIGYNLYRTQEGEPQFIKINSKPITRMESLEEFKKIFDEVEIESLIKILKLKTSAELWQKVVAGDENLVKLSFFAPKLRKAIGLGFQDENIEPGKSYAYFVVKVDKQRKESAYTVPAKTLHSKLLGPTEVKTELEKQTVKITWKPNSQETMVFGYNIYRSVHPQGLLSKLNKGPVLMAVSKGTEPRGVYIDKNVEMGQTYFYYVASADIAGNESQNKNFVEVSIKDLIPPSIPQGVKAISSASGIALSWDMVPDKDLQGYHIYRSEEWDGKYEKINKVSIPPSPALSYEDYSAQPNKEYFYIVTAVDKYHNESLPSARTRGLFENLQPPLPPQNVAATAVEKGLLIRWVANQEVDVKGYLVFRGDAADADYAQISPLLPKQTTQFKDEDSYLHPKGAYWYKVRALKATGVESPFSLPAIASPPDKIAPKQPSGISGYADYNEIKLLWDASLDNTVAGYMIYRKEGETGDWVCLTSNPILASSPRIYADKTAKRGIHYFYYVVAVDDAGNKSDPTSQVTLSLSRPVPPPPYNLRASMNDKGILVQWGRMYTDNLAGYRIYRRTAHTEYIKIAEQIIPPENTDFLDERVEPNIEYFYSIVSVSLTGQEGKKSREVLITYKKYDA